MECTHFGVNYFALTMRTAFIFVAGVLFNSVQCYDSESLEYNGIEVSPLYETIIYSDIADIINEFQNNNVAFDKANNESESDEDVEDLLSEYHRYLEKAHKQRVNYLEKNKPKNKVPVVRHEKFTKMQSTANKHHYKNNFYNSEHKFPQVQALNPFNMFIPFNSDKYLTTSEQPVYGNDLSAFKKIILTDESPMSSFPSVPVKSSCYCKDGRASCKQCFMPLDHNMQPPLTNPNTMLPADEDKPYILNNPLFPEQSDDSINVRIKVDVQLPKFQQGQIQSYNLQSRDKTSDYDAGVSKEYLSTIKLPSPYFNFPIPMNLFGYKKMSKSNKHDAPPLHKITIHKKKKSKTGNSNKKHRKKVITFHNIKIEPQLYQNHFGMFNFSINSKNETENNSTVILNLRTNKTQTQNANYTTINPVEYLNETQTEENILLLVNITNNIENITNENQKTENSIETDYTNVISNATTDKPLHLLKKREISSQEKSPTHKDKPETPQTKKTTPKTISSTHNKSTKFENTPHKKLNTRQNKSATFKKKTVVKHKNLPQKTAKKNATEIKLDKEKSNNIKLEKSLLIDTELLYWPIANANKSKDVSKNITTIILENENKKAKLNMSVAALRRDHTRALEQAIFGNVDWNDVDAVAPAFISFVGKYLEGILTFCNERICHSMKCTKKNCLHRFCEPKDRFNNKGHCTGSNYTESEASMESIMDLPSKIVFEIVDILQDRMVGKMFGKATLCINSKCITFAASKKIFHKHRCTVKELSLTGHCVNSNEVKVT